MAGLGVLAVLAGTVALAMSVAADDDGQALPPLSGDPRVQEEGRGDRRADGRAGAPANPTGNPTGQPDDEPSEANPGQIDAARPSIDEPGSAWWVVNKERTIPADYVPPDLVTPDTPIDPSTDATQLSAAAADAFEALVSEAAAAGHQLQLTSGYRSYDEQQALYDRHVRDYGPEVAAQRAALPGTSEHQTGLAADVGLVGLPDDQVFGDTAASAWVAANAHRFGFVVRYPQGKERITGYSYEPWHLRYVGVALATELHRTGLTMEEYFGL